MLERVSHLPPLDRATSGDLDGTLMHRFQESGDYPAFEQLFDRHKDGLLRFTWRLIGDRGLAEDASQQTWLKVIEVARRRGYAERPDAAFRTWLFTLARNHVIDEHKRKFASTRTVTFAGEPDAAGMDADGHANGDRDDPAEQALRHELSRRVEAALLALPFEQREVIALWALGEEPAAIAAITGAPRDTVFSRKKYALAKLRDALQDFAPVEATP
jgi:RNA polymerase sigma factor (sigma-70 family)